MKRKSLWVQLLNAIILSGILIVFVFLVTVMTAPLFSWFWR